MATAKKTAAPVKTAAPAAKKVAAKAAPVAAPAAEEAADEGDVVIEAGAQVTFLGYPDDTPEAEQVLTAGEVYEVKEVTEPAEGETEGMLVIQLENPAFNAKKKEHPESNPKLIEVEVFQNEVELVGDADEPAAEEEAPVAAAPAVKKAAGKTVAAPAAKTAKGAKVPAKVAAKKVAAKKVAKVKEEKVPEVNPIDLDLEAEDADVVELVNGSEDLIATAQELEASAGTTEYQLGGILYHIRKDKLHHNITEGANAEKYKETGGFELFLTDFFNLDYRKAMHLIKIYYAFNAAGIPDAAQVVATMGYTKASKIAPKMLAPDAEAEELVELANENTVADLSTALMEQEQAGKTTAAKPKRLTLKFRYLEEEAASINAILATAKDQYGVKDVGEALSKIIDEWATENAGGAATKAEAPRVAAKAPAKAVARRAVATA